MFLSQLILNPLSIHVQRDMANVYEMHRTIMHAFPSNHINEECARESFGILYRIDPISTKNYYQLIVQSNISPNWGILPSEYLVSTEILGINANPIIREITFIHSITEGDTFRFRLRANPTKKVNTPTIEERESGKYNNKIKKNGSRVSLYYPDDIFNWLAKKSDDAGFKVVAVNYDREPPETGKKYENRRPDDAIYPKDILSTKYHTMKFHAITFNGVLSVTNVKLFKESLEKGIGSGKSFGFGLVSLAHLD